MILYKFIWIQILHMIVLYNNITIYNNEIIIFYYYAHLLLL